MFLFSVTAYSCSQSASSPQRCPCRCSFQPGSPLPALQTQVSLFLHTGQALHNTWPTAFLRRSHHCAACQACGQSNVQPHQHCSCACDGSSRPMPDEEAMQLGLCCQLSQQPGCMRPGYASILGPLCPLAPALQATHVTFAACYLLCKPYTWRLLLSRGRLCCCIPLESVLQRGYDIAG